MRDTTAAQLERERQMRDRGQHRAEKAFSRALEQGRATETPAGVILARRALQPLADAIRAFLAPKKGAGRRHTAARLLKDVDPELAAYCTIRGSLGYAATNGTLRGAALNVTEALETELLADAFEKSNTPLFRAVVRNAEARGLPPERTAKAVALANRKFSVVEKPWTTNQRLHLGVKLVGLFIESIGIVEAHQRRESKTMNTHRLRFTPEIDEWMRKYNGAAALTRPFLLPTLIPPKPWTQPRDSAYYSTAVRGGNLVTKPFPGQLEALEAATLAGTMAPVYKGINGILSTGWRVNKRVLAVMQAAWDKGLAGLPLPPREPMVKPAVPQAVKDAEKGSQVRKDWRTLMRDWHLQDQREKNHRFEFQRALAVAEENADEAAIYFPHRLDFRGRVYAAGTTLQPQGPDEARALLEFATGKPLGERGVGWLGVHGANLFGNDKVSLEERSEWARVNRYRAIDVATDPLRHRWWTEAGKPWSFLAWCIEWADAMTQGPTFVSHMPIALDGTCNGLQHYSAMLRDEVGGKAVNLVPGDKPADIYADVAEIVRWKLTGLACEEGPAQWLVERLLQIGIDRSITKRPVMVLPYGGTYKSCHEYTSVALREEHSVHEASTSRELPKTSASSSPIKTVVDHGCGRLSSRPQGRNLLSYAGLAGAPQCC